MMMMMYMFSLRQIWHTLVFWSAVSARITINMVQRAHETATRNRMQASPLAFGIQQCSTFARRMHQLIGPHAPAIYIALLLCFCVGVYKCVRYEIHDFLVRVA